MDYTEFSAYKKRELIWDKIVNSKYKIKPVYEQSEYNNLISGITSILAPRTRSSSCDDELEYKGQRQFHRFGAIAKITFMPIKYHNYSGIFLSGALGLARFAPMLENMPPSLEIKFFIDKHPSVDMLLIPESGSGKYWFANKLSNTANDPGNKILHSMNLLNNNLNYISARNDQGILSNNNLAPEKIIFVPNPIMQKILFENKSDDFRVDLENLQKKDATLYSVKSQRGNDIPLYLGDIWLESEFISSEYCDRNLRFGY